MSNWNIHISNIFLFFFQIIDATYSLFWWKLFPCICRGRIEHIQRNWIGMKRLVTAGAHTDDLEQQGELCTLCISEIRNVRMDERMLRLHRRCSLLSYCISTSSPTSCLYRRFCFQRSYLVQCDITLIDILHIVRNVSLHLCWQT